MSFKPPEELRIHASNKAAEWQRFKQRYEVYAKASGLSTKDADVQAATFLHLVGSDAHEVYNTFEFASDSDRADPTKLKEKFAAYCTPKKNITLERHALFTRRQRAGESLDDFVTDLRLQARHCDFPASSDSIIRDCIVMGLRDQKLRERLIQENTDDTAKVIAMCKAAELTTGKVAIAREDSEVDRVQVSSNTPPLKQCRYCGDLHPPRQCPAYGKACAKCGKMNHFSKVCQSKRSVLVKSVEIGAEPTITSMKQFDSLDVDVLGTVTQSKWKEDLIVGDQSVEFKLDTGAAASVLPLAIYKKIQPCPSLKTTDVCLRGFDNSRVRPRGTATIQTSFKCTSLSVTYFVTELVESAILGQNECEAFGLVERTNHIAPCSVTEQPITSVEKSRQNILEKYATLFTGLGEFEQEYDIQIDENVTPVQQPPRKIPFAKLDKLKEALDDLKRKGVIVDEPEPTPWISNIVVTEKKSGELRICLDPKALNTAIIRDPYPAPSMDFVTSTLSGKRVFGVLDQSSAFWQVKLTEASSKLCTFNTPWGKMRFKRMPFGIRCASDVLQRRNQEIFGTIPGVECTVDDLLVAATTDEKYDQTLEEVLIRAERHNVRFNPRKFQHKVSSVKYLGHIISEEGIAVDPEKVQAITKMATPTDKTELKRYLGMVKFLSQYIPHESEITAPLRNLLREEVTWSWQPTHAEAVQRINKALTSAPVLAPYDVGKPVRIQADASQHGLGAVLMQENRPVAYASRALTETERRYAQIEKELLAVCYGCEKFRQFILGKHVDVESDHKPLEMIFQKPAHLTPLRLQRMRLRLQPYDLTIEYRPGSQMHIADALSRATVDPPEQYLSDGELVYDIEVLTNAISDANIDEFKQATKADDELQDLSKIIQTGWPGRIKSLKPGIRQYWSVRDRLTVADGLVLLGERIVIPRSLRNKVLEKIHGSHFGVEKCKARAMQSVYWPSMLKAIESAVSACHICQRHQAANQKEPMIPHAIPAIPWTKLGSDVLELNGSYFLIIVDYTSKYPEVCGLGKTKTAAAIIRKLKTTFGRFGIPTELVADNMPYASHEMQEFATQWGFKITTTSPTYSQSNGKSESVVKMAKSVLRKALEDPNMDAELAFLRYRNTPVSGMRVSPAEILFGRRLRDELPCSKAYLQPRIVNPMPDIESMQRRQKKYYDRTATAKPEFQPGDPVYVQKGRIWERATIAAKRSEPRSYDLSDGRRRSSRHIRPAPEVRNREDMGHPEKQGDEDRVSDNQPPEEAKGSAMQEMPRSTSQSPELRRSARTSTPPDRWGYS